MKDQLQNKSHKRLNILTNEWVLFSYISILILILFLNSCSGNKSEVQLKNKFKNEVFRVVSNDGNSFSFSNITEFEWDECIIIGGPYWFDHFDRLELDLPKRKGIGESQDIIVFLLKNEIKYSFKINNNRYEFRNCNLAFPFRFSSEEDIFKLSQYKLLDQKINGRYFVFMPDCPQLRIKRKITNE